MLKIIQLIFYGLITIWENIDVCADHNICAVELYLLSILSQAFNIVIDRGISEPGHGREILYGLNTKERSSPFIYWTQCNYLTVKGLIHK